MNQECDQFNSLYYWCLRQRLVPASGDGFKMRWQKRLRPCVNCKPNFFLIQRVKSDQENRVTPKTKKTDCGILPYAREVMNKYFDHVWSPLPIFDLESRVVDI